MPLHGEETVAFGCAAATSWSTRQPRARTATEDRATVNATTLEWDWNDPAPSIQRRLSPRRVPHRQVQQLGQPRALILVEHAHQMQFRRGMPRHRLFHQFHPFRVNATLMPRLSLRSSRGSPACLHPAARRDSRALQNCKAAAPAVPKRRACTARRRHAALPDAATDLVVLGSIQDRSAPCQGRVHGAPSGSPALRRPSVSKSRSAARL